MFCPVPVVPWLIAGGGSLYPLGDNTLLGNFISTIAEQATCRALSLGEKLVAAAPPPTGLADTVSWVQTWTSAVARTC